MSALSLVTPVTRRDVAMCALQCDSVDRHLSCYVKHHVIVPDDELALFDRFNGARRVVVPASELLPAWLRPMPRLLQHMGERYWWSLRTSPVSGSYLQRILRIAAASAFPEERHCILDTDIVFFRRFDLSLLLRPRPAPLIEAPLVGSPAQMQRTRTSRRLLGLKPASLPIVDFSSPIVVWDRRAIRAMIDRIEMVTGIEWVEALCSTRNICEYALYGSFVQDSARHRAEHVSTSHTRCLSFVASAPDRATIEATLRTAREDDVACSTAGLAATSIDRLGRVLAEQAEQETRVAPASVSLSAVVPAQAGTHHTMLLSSAVPECGAAAYGSPPARGRQQQSQCPTQERLDAPPEARGK